MPKLKPIDVLIQPYVVTPRVVSARQARRIRRRWNRTLSKVPRWVDVLGYVSVTVCVAAYLLGTATQFDWANALLFVPVALPAVLRRAWPSAAITFAFGAFGILHLLGVHV